MSLRKLKSILMVAAVILAAMSCKKDDEEVEIVYVDGTLRYDLPEFINPNQVLTFTPRGLSHPDGGEIGYYWKVTPTMTKYDTTRFLNGLNKDGKPSDGSFTHKFSDTLQTYTVSCNAFSEDYSTSSRNLNTTVVAAGPEKSITGTGIAVGTDPYVSIDGKDYYYTTIGGLDWFRQDLAYTTSGIPFRNGEAMDGVFGRFYNHEEALKACPEGWRLPTDQEWTDMAKIVSGNDTADYLHKDIPGIAGTLKTDAYFNGEKMWEYWPSAGKTTNASHLGVIPTGYANLEEKSDDGEYPQAVFKGVYEYSAHWTADVAEGGLAYYRYIYCKLPDMFIGKADTKTFGAAVRCVRNAENQTIEYNKTDLK